MPRRRADTSSEKIVLGFALGMRAFASTLAWVLNVSRTAARPVFVDAVEPNLTGSAAAEGPPLRRFGKVCDEVRKQLSAVVFDVIVAAHVRSSQIEVALL